jgi:hypothetical protein
MAFAKLKVLPRKAAERTVDGLWSAICCVSAPNRNPGKIADKRL